MSEIQTGLLITVIGMGLVFIMITVLWGLMALLVKVTSRKTEIETEQISNELLEAPTSVPSSIKMKAAAVAISLAIASRKKITSTNTSSEINLWQGAARIKQIQNHVRRGQRK